MPFSSNDLRQALSDAIAFKQRFSRFAPNKPSAPFDIPFIPLCLHFPDDFHTSLHKLQLCSEAHNLLENSLAQVISSYQEMYARCWKELCTIAAPSALRSLLPSIIDRTRTSLQIQFERDLDKFLSAASEIDIKRDIEPECRRPFNNDYIPFLKLYFEYDSYPSPEDHKIMAQKSGMTTRQIEVWFQNHRRIAKKSGMKITKRQSSRSGYTNFIFIDQPSPPQKANEEKMEEIEQQVKTEAAHQDLKYKSVGAPRYTRFTNAHDIFDQPAPAHTFPTAFKCPSKPEQFQHRNWRPHFPPPQWARKPSTNHAETPRNEEDVKVKQKELCSAVEQMQRQFAQLSVRDATKVNSGMPPAATFAIYLTPAPAPHPALMRSTTGLAVASTVSQTLSAPSVQSMQTGRRKKVAGPPRRTPKHAPRCPTPSSTPYIKPSSSNNSTSRSPSPSSRTPSLESPSSPLTRHSSVSSLSSIASTSSSTSPSSLFSPVTPESSTIPLPFEPSIAIVDPDVAAYFNNDEFFGLPLDQGGLGFSFDDPFAFDGGKDAFNPALFPSFSDVLTT